MLSRSLASLTLFMLVVDAGAAAAQETTTRDLRLAALGGAAVQIPVWKEVRKDAAIAIYEQLPEPAAQKPYYVLVCTLEEGPPKGQPIAWEKVRDNIVQAASKNGRTLTLEANDAFGGAATFEGRKFAGEFRSTTPDKKVAIELIALVKEGKLLTIGLVSEAATPATAELLQAIAKTARLGPFTP